MLEFVGSVFGGTLSWGLPRGGVFVSLYEPCLPSLVPSHTIGNIGWWGYSWHHRVEAKGQSQVKNHGQGRLEGAIAKLVSSYIASP